MFSSQQGELFGLHDYTFMCSNCRGEFPRSIEFFPEGRCKDKLASYCRKCLNIPSKKQTEIKRNKGVNELKIYKEKICEDCGITKGLREFYMSSLSLDGKTKFCKSCIDLKNTERKANQKYFNGFTWSVYFIQDSRNKMVKIGYTDDPEKTLSYLQEGSSEKLCLLAIHELDRENEAENAVKTLHSFFKAHQKRKDWFEMSASLNQFISLLKSNDNESVISLLNTENLTKKIY